MRSDPGVEVESEGLEGPPRYGARRLLRLVVLGLLCLGAIWTVAMFGGRLPQDTATGSLVIRASVGLAIGVVLIAVVRRMMGALSEAPVELPKPVDARVTDVVYVCPVCGTRVRLELAATAKAPRHCGEEMEPSLGG